MPDPKKIFFAYSSQDEDLGFYNRINKHFIAYSKVGFLAIVDKSEIFKISGDSRDIYEIQNSTDITIPLLSVDFVNDEECIKQLDNAVTKQKIIIPILIRDFDWEAFQKISQYRKQMLPADLTPVENHIVSDQNDDTIFREIAQSVKAIILPEIGNFQIQKSPNSFYYILSSIVFTIGIIASVIVYIKTGGLEQAERILFTALCFLMFACIGFISLKNVLFPNKVKIKK
jgi:hypothetical protein